MSKKGGEIPSNAVFEYNCTCGAHFQQIGQAVAHINKFRDHQLSRIIIEKKQ